MSLWRCHTLFSVCVCMCVRSTLYRFMLVNCDLLLYKRSFFFLQQHPIVHLHIKEESYWHEGRDASIKLLLGHFPGQRNGGEQWELLVLEHVSSNQKKYTLHSYSAHHNAPIV